MRYQRCNKCVFLGTMGTPPCPPHISFQRKSSPRQTKNAPKQRVVAWFVERLETDDWSISASRDQVQMLILTQFDERVFARTLLLIREVDFPAAQCFVLFAALLSARELTCNESVHAGKTALIRSNTVLGQQTKAHTQLTRNHRLLHSNLRFKEWFLTTVRLLVNTNNRPNSADQESQAAPTILQYSSPPVLEGL